MKSLTKIILFILWFFVIVGEIRIILEMTTSLMSELIPKTDIEYEIESHLLWIHVWLGHSYHSSALYLWLRVKSVFAENRILESSPKRFDRLVIYYRLLFPVNSNICTELLLKLRELHYLLLKSYRITNDCIKSIFILKIIFTFSEYFKSLMNSYLISL